MFRKPLILLLGLWLLNIASVQAERFKVVFLNPGFPEQNETGQFWSNVTHFMQAAANDLDIELVTIYAYRNHILMRSLIDDIMGEQPDYVVLVNEKNTVFPLVRQLALRKTPIFMLLNNLTEVEKTLLTTEQKAFLYGSIIPDNFHAGQALISDLVKLYQRKNQPSKNNQQINLLAIQGDHTTPASIERQQGLLSFLRGNPTIELIDSSAGNWAKQTAYQKVKGALQRRNIDIIWTANDAMAFGAKQAVAEAKLKNSVLIGGVNWDTDDSQYPVDISYGGHVVLGAFALVMLRDIDAKMLASEEKNQQLMIFESSDSEYAEPFKQRLAAKNFEGYNFSLFSQAQQEPFTFSIADLTRAFIDNKP